MTFVRPVEAALRILERTEVNGLFECWPYTGALAGKGYGQIKIEAGGRIVQALVHRVMYEALVGPIPVGLELDHVSARGCTLRSCVNPRHLEPVTHTENMRRAADPFCRKGHLLAETRFYCGVDGKPRGCSICRRSTLTTQNERTRLAKYHETFAATHLSS